MSIQLRNAKVDHAQTTGRAPDDMPDDEAARFETYLYHITHDLRACFRAMKIIPDWIREDLERAAPEGLRTVAAHLEMLDVQARRGDRILLDLRDYSRVGRLADPPGAIDLNALVDEAIQAAKVPEAFKIDRWLEAPMIYGPRNDYLRLFTALLSNAVKHHDRGEGQIWILSEGTGKHVSLRVQDDGPGIAAPFRERVFDLLTTLKPRDMCEGSGVGLALARKVVQQAGGRIEVQEPEQGQGTSVTFTLPCVAKTDQGLATGAADWTGVQPTPAL